MHNLRKLLFLIGISVSIVSCKKNNEPMTPGVYHTTGLTQTSNTRLFTNGKEITDNAIINKFIAGDSDFNLTYQSSSTSAITFISSDTATFWGTSLKYSVVKSSNLYLFYSLLYHPISAATDYPQFLQYNGPIIEQPVGENFSESVTPAVNVVHVNSGKLVLSVLVYKVVLANFYHESDQGIVYNDFNEGVKLALNDTLAIKEYTMSLR